MTGRMEEWVRKDLTCPHCTHSQINPVEQKTFLGNQHFLSDLKIPHIYGTESLIYCVH